jgi:hypothetical protein
VPSGRISHTARPSLRAIRTVDQRDRPELLDVVMGLSVGADAIAMVESCRMRLVQDTAERLSLALRHATLGAGEADAHRHTST